MPESYFEGYWLPISSVDLDAVQGIIRQHEIFCALAPDANLYECLTRDIARVFLCHAYEPKATEVTLRKFFEINWEPNDGVYLAELALALQRDEGNLERMSKRNLSSSYPDQLAAQLESNVLAWRPNDQTDQ